MRFPFVRPEIAPPSEWIGDVEEAYANRHFTNFGVVEQRLSQSLQERYGSEGSSVVLACNATAALSAALIAHGVKGKVVIPDFTFPATLHAVLGAGCTPVLCDVHPNTCEMDAAHLQALCDAHEIAAVMPVRTYGFVRALDPILSVARRHGIPVIVDAAAALGGGIVSVAPDLTEVFSLHATKSFGIGEGGAIFAHEDLRARLMSALNFGLLPDRRFGAGLNGKMTEIQAAVGLAQLRHMDRLVAGRAEMAKWYFERLNGSDVTFPIQPGPTSWSNFPVILPQGTDVALLQDLAHKVGYQVRRYYWPSLRNGYLGELADSGPLPTSSDLSERAVCLPLYSDSTPAERDEIGRILVDLFAGLSLRIAS